MCTFFSIKRFYFYFLLTVNARLSPPLGLFILSQFKAGGGVGGGLNRDGRLFNLEKTMASVLHNELECKVEKLKYKKF